MDKTDTNRLTLDLPAELHRQIKIAAATRGVSMRELVEEWIRAGLQQADKSNPE